MWIQQPQSVQYKSSQATELFKVTKTFHYCPGFNILPCKCYGYLKYNPLHAIIAQHIKGQPGKGVETIL